RFHVVGEARFLFESHQALAIRARVLRKNLDRDVATEVAVAGAVHLSHHAGPDGRVDLERAGANAGRRRHDMWLWADYIVLLGPGGTTVSVGELVNNGSRSLA